MSDASDRPRPLLAAALAGAVGGAAAGVVDGVLGWTRAAQFVPGVGERLRFVVYLALAYAGVAALVAAAASALLRAGRLAAIGAHLAESHAARRATSPSTALAPLSLAIVAPPVVVAAIGGAHAVLGPTLAGRKDASLVVAAAIAGGVVALLAAVAAAFALARPIEALVAALGRTRPRLATACSSPRAMVAVLLVWLSVGGGLALAWAAARQVPSRPALAATIGGVFVLASWTRGHRLAARVPLGPRGVAPLAGAAFAALVALLWSGAPAEVIQAAARHSGLGGAIAEVARTPFDLDGDGYARLLGGGDCDDGDAAVHPGAIDIPDDGVDQNCAGGDAHQPGASDLGFAPVPPSVPSNTNVLLLTIDTLRADHLGSYGYPRPTSPALDRVAAEGTRFVHGWAHAPSTRYSMPAILTGRYPLAVFYDHSIDGWPGLAPRATTLAEALATRGFHNGAITNYWYFDEVRRMNQGYASYDNRNKRLHVQAGDEGPKHTRGSSSKEQTDRAIEFVRAAAGRRWHLWVHYYDPHSEYEPHAEVPPWGDAAIDRYDGEIRFTDLQIGRLLDELRARGEYDRTIIVVTGDHGEGFGEHGIDLHGYHLYAPQTRVPMIVRVPGLPARASETPASHVDLLPTILNLVGATADAPEARDLQGRSLVPWLAGAPDEDHPVFQQLSYEGNHELRAVATQRCHVIYNVSPHPGWEAYRLDRDPLENLGVDGAGCGEARAQLLRWIDASSIPAGAAEALLPGPPTLAAPLSVYFGDEVELLDVALPPTVRAGEAVSIRWTFAAHGRLPDGWKVFAHFERDGGGQFQGDHAPTRPLSWWRAGQFIQYTTELTVPRATPPGRYVLRAGLWRGQQRRPSRGAVPIVDDRAEVGALEVVR